jgi:hypothetical protein
MLKAIAWLSWSVANNPDLKLGEKVILTTKLAGGLTEHEEREVAEHQRRLFAEYGMLGRNKQFIKTRQRPAPERRTKPRYKRPLLPAPRVIDGTEGAS